MSDEEAQREAERKAAALHNVGWEVGAGATIWARAVQDVLALHESARESWASGTTNLEAWERLHSSALMLVVAVDQVLAFEQRVRSLTGDAELARARERFDARCPGAGLLRDLVAHLDAYAVGKGERQTGYRQRPISAENLATFIYWGDGCGTYLDLGDQRLNLRTAAGAAADPGAGRRASASPLPRARRERGQRRGSAQVRDAARVGAKPAPAASSDSCRSSARPRLPSA